MDGEEEEGARERCPAPEISLPVRQALEQEDEFLAYLLTLADTRPHESHIRDAHVGLDHLDNLCKLMEQLSDLREHNSRLQRRVQYLEDLKDVHDMYKQIHKRSASEHDTDMNSLRKHQEKMFKSGAEVVEPVASRERSKSVGLDELAIQTKPFSGAGLLQQRKSVAGLSIPPKSKVSKWTKVKEAFRWEKASLGISSLPIVSTEQPSEGSPENGSESKTTIQRHRRPDHPPSNIFRAYESSPPAALKSTTITEISSSSSSEEMEMNFNELMAHYARTGDYLVGKDRSASISEATEGPKVTERRLSLAQPSTSTAAKQELDDFNKEKNRTQFKGTKTPWTRVKTMLQTSVKKKKFSDAEAGGSRQQSPESMSPSGEAPPRCSTSPVSSSARLSVSGMHPNSTPSSSPSPSPSDNPQVSHSDSATQTYDGTTNDFKETDKLQIGGTPPPRKQRVLTLSPIEYRERHIGMPTLTITLPSTEELGPPEPSSPSKIDSASPPVSRRMESKWRKVKNAFLTSSAPSSSTVRTPTIPEPSSSGFQYGNVISESDNDVVNSIEKENIYVEIQKNYGELQQKLSEEFHKKLYEWEKNKSGFINEEGQQRRLFKDWNQNKPLSGSSENALTSLSRELRDENLSAEFRKKLQEWQRKSSTNPGHLSRNGKSTSPPFTRRCSSQHNSTGVSPSTSHIISQKQKTQKDKDLHWLEKELQKMEREKQRLERERHKFKERAKRLEKMRQAMESNLEEEILIQTSTGFFRFNGISEKFAKKLYEWEQARGIGPEASTFTLLDPDYQKTKLNLSGETGLSRARSVTNVTDSINLKKKIPGDSGASVSSLSLNDIPPTCPLLEGDSRATSEPQLLKVPEDINKIKEIKGNDEDNGPAAVIVDIEDVEIETAAVFEMSPVAQRETPVYCYTPNEVTRINEQDSDGYYHNEKSKPVQRNDSIHTESSYKLIQENIEIIEKLKIKSDFCRKLENEIGRLGQPQAEVEEDSNRATELLPNIFTDDSSSGNNENVDDNNDISSLQVYNMTNEQFQKKIDDIKKLNTDKNIKELQGCYEEQSTEHAALAHHLVDKMRQLSEVNQAMVVEATANENDINIEISPNPIVSDMAVAHRIHNLSSELIHLAERLEIAVARRNDEVHSLRFQLRSGNEGMKLARFDLREEALDLPLQSVPFYSNPDTKISPQNSEDLDELPSILTQKVIELKDGLLKLCPTAGKKKRPLERQCAINEGLSLTSPESSPDKNNAIKKNRRIKRSKETKEKGESKLQTTSLENNKSNESINKDPNPEKKSLIPVEKVVEFQVENSTNLDSNSNVIVKTTRKIFSPVYDPENKLKNLTFDSNESTSECSSKESSTQVVFSGQSQVANTNPEAFAGKIRANTSSPSWMNRAGSPYNSPALQRRAEPKLNNFKSSVPMALNNINTTEDKNEQQLMIDNSQDETLYPLSDKHRKTSVDSINFERNIKTGKPKSSLEEKCALPPQSPSSIRKIACKETAPSIRMMIAKYNQKLTEQDGQGDLSGSGSVSPVAWRSPVAERRVLAQTAKYAEDMAKSNWPGPRYGIAKSSTSSLIGIGSSSRQTTNSTDTSANSTPRSLRKHSQINIYDINQTSAVTQASPQSTSLKGILKSPSSSTLRSQMSPDSNPEDEISMNLSSTKSEKEVVIQTPKEVEQIPDTSENSNLKSSPIVGESSAASHLRALRIQKAKQEFLERGLPLANLESSHAGNRLSQISAASLSSYEGGEQNESQQQLYKSVSAGMINVDPDAYRNITNDNPDTRPSTSYLRFGLHSLAFRLRKGRRTRDRDVTKMNTIQALCRQSLIVDLNVESDQAAPSTSTGSSSTPSTMNKTRPLKNSGSSGSSNSTSKSCPASPVLARGSAVGGPARWFLNSKLFRPSTPK